MSHEDPAHARGAAGGTPWNLQAELHTFLCDRVRSPEALEVLRLLTAPPHRWWLLTDLSRELAAADWIVEEAVQTLFEARLLIRTPERARFRHSPKSHAYRLVRQCLATYADHPLEVVRLLNSRAVGRVRVRLDALANELLGKQYVLRGSGPR